MKIAVVRQRYVPIGGAERYLHAVATELAARGHEVHLFAHSWNAPPADNLHFHRVPMVPAPGFLRALSFALWSRKLTARAHCDLIFSLERTLQQDVYRAGDGSHREWLLQRSKYSSIGKRARLAINPLHPTLLALERRTFSPQRTGWIIANSQRGREEIIRHYAFPADRIRVVYTGVDCDRFKPGGSPRSASDFNLLFVGTGFERKGLKFCIQALAKLPDRVKLKVVGKGNTGPYQRLAHDLGVARRLEFLGYNLDMPAVYPTADVLVHPAIYEPFANVCLEALACGLPVVTSRINGASEIIQPGGNGAIVEHPDDIDGLARAIQPFLNRDHLAAAAKHASATALAHPFSAHVSETLEVLSSVRSSMSGAAVGRRF
jgi:UDP-glucose:(heptosyl)LPS alpha-1,3-glucosyltransferase